MYYNNNDFVFHDLRLWTVNSSSQQLLCHIFQKQLKPASYTHSRALQGNIQIGRAVQTVR